MGILLFTGLIVKYSSPSLMGQPASLGVQNRQGSLPVLAHIDMGYPDVLIALTQTQVYSLYS